MNLDPTLNFTMKTWFFGPTYSANTGIIKNIDVNLGVPGGGISSFDANPNNTDSVIRLNITPGQDANGNPLSTSTPLYTYNLANTTGVFYVTEKVYADSDKNDFAYVRTSNSSQLTSYNTSGTIDVGSVITGEQPGATAHVVSVSIAPGPSVDWNPISANSDWSFIVDIIENL